MLVLSSLNVIGLRRSCLTQPNGNVDHMSAVNVSSGKKTVVVGESHEKTFVGVSVRGRDVSNRWSNTLVALFVALMCLCATMWITPFGYADDDSGTGMTITDNITDTENLLGSNVAEITDAIEQTKNDTGVTVRLLYLASFNSDQEPDEWASSLLESLDPDPNTVLLAVASNDGNLVVAVSSNSDEWLKKKSTVEALSDAAQKPLMESTPNWAKSATDMMDQIALENQTSTSSRMKWLGVGGMIAVLVLLVVVIIVFHMLRKRNKSLKRHRRSKGRHSGYALQERSKDDKAASKKTVKADVKDKPVPPEADSKDADEVSMQDSESVQVTSSEEREA